MSSFLSLYARSFAQPRLAFGDLVREPRRVGFGARGVAITGAVYTLVYFFLSRNGGRPTAFHPWLAIEAEHYYDYNLYLHAPSLLLAWIAAAGFTQLSARALGGKGSFEDTLAVLGFGVGVATWATGLHDLVTTCLGFVGALDQRAYEDAMSTSGPAHVLIWSLMLVYVAWLWVLFGKGVVAAHALSSGRAFAAGSVGLVVYQLLFALFNR